MRWTVLLNWTCSLVQRHPPLPQLLIWQKPCSDTRLIFTSRVTLSNTVVEWCCAVFLIFASLSKSMPNNKTQSDVMAWRFWQAKKVSSSQREGHWDTWTGSAVMVFTYRAAALEHSWEHFRHLKASFGPLLPNPHRRLSWISFLTN